MAIDDHTSPDPTDCFGPPAEPILVFCIHCGKSYMSSEIWWDPGEGPSGGFWRCGTPNCSGAGFTFDIYPFDGAMPEGVEGGWFDDDGNPCPPPWLSEED